MKTRIQRSCLERYLMAGIFIFGAGHLQYRLLYALLSGVPLRAGTAWALHFVLGTLWTHALHRRFTFRHMPQIAYRASLARTYGAYMILWALSTLTMVLLCDVYGRDPMVGWFAVTTCASALNFLVMSRWSVCAPRTAE